MMDKKIENVIESLCVIGKNETLRYKFLELCHEVEECIKLDNKSVRDEVTSSIIVALHSRVGILHKTVKPGIIFNYKYTSKISRELVMSKDSEPDHVWEPQTTKLLIHLSKNVEHVLIGGGYFGDQAIIVGNSIKDKSGICHVFEPNSELFEMLELNKKNNDLTNMVLNCTGLWSDGTSKLRLVGDDDSLAYSEVVDFDKIDNKAISAISINTYGNEKNIKKIGLIMLDIEGGEYEVLKGAGNYLKQSPADAPILIFEVHRHYCDWSSGLEKIKIIQFLKEFGYQIFAIRDYQAHVKMGDSPIELIPSDRTYLEGPPHGFNMLAIKDRSLVKNDIFRICYDVSPKLLKHKDPLIHQPFNH